MSNLAELAKQYAIIKEQKEFFEQKAKSLNALMEDLAEKVHGEFINTDTLSFTVSGSCFRDGKSRTVSPTIKDKPSYRKEDANKIGKWFALNGHDSMVSQVFKFKEMPDDIKKMLLELDARLTADGLGHLIHLEVHQKTLASFVSKAKKEGKPLPPDLKNFELKTCSVRRVPTKKGVTQ